MVGLTKSESKDYSPAEASFSHLNIRHVAPGTLKTYIYHGPDRHLASSSPSPLPYHIVFSTYGTVAADFIGGGGVLNWFHWYRLILDEGKNGQCRLR
jgi:hypothetical protein